MAKARKQFILDTTKIRRVRQLLGATTDTEAVNTALDILIGNTEIVQIHKNLAGRLNLIDMDQSKFSG